MHMYVAYPSILDDIKRMSYDILPDYLFVLLE